MARHLKLLYYNVPNRPTLMCDVMTGPPSTIQCFNTYRRYNIWDQTFQNLPHINNVTLSVNHLCTVIILLFYLEKYPLKHCPFDNCKSVIANVPDHLIKVHGLNKVEYRSIILGLSKSAVLAITPGIIL